MVNITNKILKKYKKYWPHNGKEQIECQFTISLTIKSNPALNGCLFT